MGAPFCHPEGPSKVLVGSVFGNEMGAGGGCALEREIFRFRSR